MHRLLVPLAVTAAVLFSATCSMGHTAAPSTPETTTGTPTDTPTDTPTGTPTDTPTDTPTTEAPVAPDGEARYRVTFDAVWSAQTHPTNFPSRPHFSGLVGATHDESTRIWQRGELASDGVELMAETGGTSTLLAEVDARIADGNALAKLSGGGLPTSPSSVSLEFDVVSSHPYVTLVSMLAPSPDWFVGVSALPLMENGAWLERVEVDLRLYDAGTDDGTLYTAANADTDPAEPITRLTESEAGFTDGEPVVGNLRL
jgi:hypothetical protein